MGLTSRTSAIRAARPGLRIADMLATPPPPASDPPAPAGFLHATTVSGY
jgi:hypothetical protein